MILRRERLEARDEPRSARVRLGTARWIVRAAALSRDRPALIAQKMNLAGAARPQAGIPLISFSPPKLLAGRGGAAAILSRGRNGAWLQAKGVEEGAVGIERGTYQLRAWGSS